MQLVPYTSTFLPHNIFQSVIKRLEREKELLKVSIQELEEERDRLKQQLKVFHHKTQINTK